MAVPHNWPWDVLMIQWFIGSVLHGSASQLAMGCTHDTMVYRISSPWQCLTTGHGGRRFPLAISVVPSLYVRRHVTINKMC